MTWNHADSTNAPAAVLLIWLMAGLVFLSEASGISPSVRTIAPRNYPELLLAIAFSKFPNTLAYDNYVWQLRENGKRAKLRPSPAVMAGKADHVWTKVELTEAMAS